ncbi:MAG: hypothetical protein K6G07_08830 [Lachnospiraceae bacterium]|nr:hypothetical protein [Lachnospiraceae bacterium]
MSNKNTPYDDSFRTLLTDCKRLVIPLVNELFHTEYNYLSEDVQVYHNEHFVTEGDDQERITDSNFSIGKNKDRFHIECQTSYDGTIVVRIFEYSTQIAKSDFNSNDNTFEFTIPRSGVLCLRNNNQSPSCYIVKLKTPGGTVSYEIPTIQMRDYSIGGLLDKKLFFLIPFYFFNYPLEKMDNDNGIEEMISQYQNLWKTLDDYVENGLISAYERASIKAMCNKVAESLTKNYPHILKGVEKVMGGAILEYEAKKIYTEGEAEGETRKLYKLVQKGTLSVSDAAKDMGVPEDIFVEKMKAFLNLPK